MYAFSVFLVHYARLSIGLSALIYSCTWQVDLALDEILHLQVEGTSDQDVSTILELEQRAHENGLQVNFLFSFVSSDVPFGCQVMKENYIGNLTPII